MARGDLKIIDGKLSFMLDFEKLTTLTLCKFAMAVCCSDMIGNSATTCPVMVANTPFC
jgi:hypothetical protein